MTSSGCHSVSGWLCSSRYAWASAATGRMTDPRSSRIKALDLSFWTRKPSTSQCQPLALPRHTGRKRRKPTMPSPRACSEGTVMSNAPVELLGCRRSLASLCHAAARPAARGLAEHPRQLAL